MTPEADADVVDSFYIAEFGELEMGKGFYCVEEVVVLAMKLGSKTSWCWIYKPSVGSLVVNDHHNIRIIFNNNCLYTNKAQIIMTNQRIQHYNIGLNSTVRILLFLKSHKNLLPINESYSPIRKN